MKTLQSPPLGRAGAFVIATAIASTSLLSVAAPAQAQSAGDRAVSAGRAWLKAQLTNGLLVGEFGPSYGPSIDAGLAFVETGDAGGVTAVDTALRGAINNYIAGDAFGDEGSTYAGATAKAATFAVVADANPESYGGVNLIDRLEAQVSMAPESTGRIKDTSSFGDFANVIGQSFAARSLTSVSSDLADETTAFLLQQQCDAGFFRFGLTADTSSADQGCVTGAADSAPDLDTTSIAVINLLSTPGASPSEIAAARSGAAWLETQQSADGSFGDGTDDGANANTTGLAGWAMGEAGKTAAATKAAAWLRRVQIADLAPCAATLTADNGAIALSPADLAATRTAGGIPSGQRFSYAFATAQALPALAYVPAGGDVTIAAPASAVENSTVAVTLAGLGAGEPACVSLGSQVKPVTGTGSDLAVSFNLPATVPAAHTFTVTTLAGAQSATTTVAAPPAPAPAPAPAPVVGDLTVAKVEKVGRNNRFKVSVACDAAEACTGRIKVRTAAKVERASGKKARLVVAKAAYEVQPGRTSQVTLKLTKPARAFVGAKRIRVVATQTARGADPVATKFWLRRK